MRSWIRNSMVVLSLGIALAAPAAAQENGKEGERPTIELAILLDTSGSMEGLINQARTRLWDIVNAMATTKKDGVAPDLRVALYEYGKQTQPAENGYIRQIVPLTNDLDKISQELFALTTDGGDEYCGMVIQKAVAELQWTEGNQYRAIFIAGNEPFTQGPVSYEEACAAAIGKGIMVNTIHCGSEQEARDGKWDHAPTLADGQWINIDQNTESVQIAAPQDARLAELGRGINDTYIPYGDVGRERQALQKELDEATEQSGGAQGFAQRAAAKGGAYYKNAQWDLVDGLTENAVDLSTVKDEDLPEEMRGLSLEEKKAYVEKKAAERKKIQEEIQQLNQDRQAYVDEERKKLQAEGQDTFDSAVKKMLETQLEKKGFDLENEK